jgi:hypothetical protein
MFSAPGMSAAHGHVVVDRSGHAADDSSPCLWAGVGSESGKCPDRCASLNA